MMPAADPQLWRPGVKPEPRTVLSGVFSYHALLGIGLTAVVACTVSNRFWDPDLWWHLRLGQMIWTTHLIPTTDVFSYTTHNHSWTAHEWLAQLSIYGAYRLCGYRGLMLWLSAFASATFLLVYIRSWKASENALLAFLGGLLAWFLGTVGLAIRPLVLGHMFLALELVILDLSAKNRRWLWCLPPLFAVWANCHGSYFFGMAVLAIYWVTVILRRGPKSHDAASARLFGLVLLASAAAICCNPVGFGLLIYPLDTLFHQSAALGSTEEWLPPPLLASRTLAMLGAFVGILLIAVWRPGRLTLRELLLVVMAFGLAIEHRRMLFLFGIVVAPILCRMLAAEFRSQRERDHPFANGVLMFGCIAVVLLVFPSEVTLEKQVREKSPLAAIEYIRQLGLHGPVLNEYIFGGYMIWAWREEKVFIDGRADVFDWTGVLNDYLRWILLDDDPTRLLNTYGIRLCMLSPEASMTRVMPYLPGWRKVYSDKVAVVFAR